MMRCWAEEHSSLFKVLRIGHTFGPGEEAYQKIIPQTMKQLMNGESPKIWGTGNDLRSFIYIDDVVDAILNAVVTNENLPAINIVGKNAIAIKDLVKLIVEISQKNTNLEFLSNNVPQRDLLFDNSLMVSLLGAEKITLREGLKAEWNYLITKK
jgi:nucleoside-diphosphate-sugar epimerase